MNESAPSTLEILGQFSFDLPWLAAFALAAALYGAAMRRSRASGQVSRHSRVRALAFAAGLVALWLAVLGPLEHYGSQLLWANFLGVLVITMVAAPLLVLAAPLTLAFRVAGPAWRSRLRALYRSKLLQALTFPVVSWLLFAIVTYLWQFTALAEAAARNAFVRDAQQLTLLFVGLAFWYPALASDPLRWRLHYPLRALYVVVEMAHKALFGAMFLGLSSPIHPYFAENLPAWGPSPIDDQHYAVLILWIGGHIIFAIALVGIIIRWMQFESRNSRRVDLRLAREREAVRRRRAALEQVFQKHL